MTDSHNIRRGLDIEFADGETRVVFPLTISALRKFVKILEKLQNTTDTASMTDEDIDNMMDAASVILAKIDPDLANNREALEDAVDLSSFNKMMGVAMGVTDPNE